MVFKNVSDSGDKSVTRSNKTGKIISSISSRRNETSSRPKVNFQKFFKKPKSSKQFKSIQVNRKFAIDPRASKFLKKAQTKGISIKATRTPTSRKTKPSSVFGKTKQSKSTQSKIAVNNTTLRSLFSNFQDRINSSNSPSIKANSTIQQRKSGVFNGSIQKNNVNLQTRLDAVADKLNLPRGSKATNEDLKGFISQGGVKPLGFDSILFSPKSPTGFSAGGTPLARVPDPDSSTGFSFQPATQQDTFNPFEGIFDFLFGRSAQTQQQPSTTETTNIFETVTLPPDETVTDGNGIPEDTSGNIFGGASGDLEEEGQDSEGFLSSLINDPVKLGIGIITVVTLLAGVLKK